MLSAAGNLELFNLTLVTVLRNGPFLSLALGYGFLELISLGSRLSSQWYFGIDLVTISFCSSILHQLSEKG